MLLDDALLQKLERLTMTQIHPQKRQEVKKQLEDILQFIQKISEVNTQDITLETSQKTPLREDVITTDQDLIAKVLEHAPNAQSHFFIVPKIIE